MLSAEGLEESHPHHHQPNSETTNKIPNAEKTGIKDETADPSKKVDPTQPESNKGQLLAKVYGQTSHPEDRIQAEERETTIVDSN